MPKYNQGIMNKEEVGKLFFRIHRMIFRILHYRLVCDIKSQINIIKKVVSRLPYEGALLTGEEQNYLLGSLDKKYQSWPAAMYGERRYTGTEWLEICEVIYYETEPFTQNILQTLGSISRH
ncbi:hypothetical protein I5N29_23765 [Serratia marcescens]|nr:hypothetical protein [Serratia marcescens]